MTQIVSRAVYFYTINKMKHLCLNFKNTTCPVSNGKGMIKVRIADDSNVASDFNPGWTE